MPCSTKYFGKVVENYKKLPFSRKRDRFLLQVCNSTELAIVIFFACVDALCEKKEKCEHGNQKIGQDLSTLIGGTDKWRYTAAISMPP